VKLAGRIFLAYLIISIACFSYPVSHFFKEVATLYNGEIRLENLPGKGLRATLNLPA
jgi:hypothetical protein